MELRHGRAQQLGRFAQRVRHAVERSRIGRRPSLFEVLPCRQHVLQGTVVQVLGERLAFSVFQRRQLGDQLAAIDDEAPDGEHAVPGQPRQKDAAHTDAGEDSRAQDDGRPRLAVRLFGRDARARGTPPRSGPATAVQTQGRNWVAASSGIMKNPLTNTSDVQLWFTEELAAKARPANAARSTNNANHMKRTSWSARRWASQATPIGPHRVNRRNGVARHPIARGRNPQHHGENEGDQDAPQDHLDPHAARGVVKKDRLQLRLIGQVDRTSSGTRGAPMVTWSVDTATRADRVAWPRPPRRRGPRRPASRRGAGRRS